MTNHKCRVGLHETSALNDRCIPIQGSSWSATGFGETIELLIARRVKLLDSTQAYVFTALHGMQTRSSDKKSVCLSVKRVNCDKTEERYVQIFITYERPFSLVF